MILIPNIINECKIPENKITIQKNIINNNKHFNDFANVDEYILEKTIQIKYSYFNKNKNDITHNKNLWENHSINKALFSFSWDDKANIFSFNFSFLNKNDVSEITIKLNDKHEFKIKPILNYKNTYYNLQLNSSTVLNNCVGLNNLKSIQIYLKNKEISKSINLLISNLYDNYNKFDYQIKKNKSLQFKFQKSVSLLGDQIRKSFRSLKLSHCNISQDFWNEKILKIEDSKDLYERNSILIQSIENLPTSINSNENFIPSIVNDGKNDFVSITENTYYDLKSEKTIKGFGKNSRPGYIAPFNYSGTFFPVVSLKINNMNFKISWSVSFDKPYFEQNKGIIKLTINTSDLKNYENNYYKISKELLEVAIKNDFNLDEFINYIKRGNNQNKTI